ncbi:hypothetical protein [Williamsia maris]|uniref:hypothetical protein n=1 Tax=Williamsia maris TaxID=72806 RepID=UPI0020A34777|nr:hypothetical protein [Williamsia maris]
MTRSFVGRRADRLIALGDALGALGSDGVMPGRRGDVPVSAIVGSASRTNDFDTRFRPRHRNVRARHSPVGAMGVPPVRLVQLGELYFVVDGHHRIGAAIRARLTTVEADVAGIRTVAFASACVRPHHLPAKAAERRFLERVPLDHAIRPDLWLDDPAHWSRLTDAVEAWGFRRTLDSRTPTSSREELAAVWWSEEVLPTVRRMRSRDPGAGDRRVIESYSRALCLRDRGTPV